MARNEHTSRELTRVEPSSVLTPAREIERWLDDFFRSPFPSLWSRPWFSRRLGDLETMVPSVDMFEDGDDLVVKAELPGMSKEDISVNLRENLLTISGERKREETVDKKGYYRLERAEGSFKRTFRLPCEIQSAKAEAKYENGVLEIRMPMAETAREREKKVPIH